MRCHLAGGKSRIFLRMLNRVIMLFITVVQKLNQGVGKKSVVYLFFLDFFGLFLSRKKYR
jgi:hypothetical protein